MRDDLQLALALADAADALTLPAFDRGEVVTAKADGTPVTEADRAVEWMLRERLAAERPDDAVLGEELGVAGGGGARRWVLDATPLLRAARLSGGFESFLALMLVAEGAVDAAFAPRGFLWDLLPAQLIVEEAGGTFTDFDGRRTADGRGAIAANPVLHAAVLALLQSSAASSR